MRGMTSSTAMRSARRDVHTQLVVARSAAVRLGRQSRLVRSGNVLSITVDSAGTFVPLAGAKDFAASHNVTLGMNRDTISFDPRGFANTVDATVVRFTREGTTDSLCVTRLGKVAEWGCGS